jgi:hypothetical protein
MLCTDWIYYFVQEHDPDADDDPLRQGVHFADPAALYVPAAHGVHSNLAVEE